MIGFNKFSATSETEIEERKNSLPIVGERIKVATKNNYAGQFGVPQWSQTKTGASIPQWYSCREGFQPVFNKDLETFAFAVKPKTSQNVVAFIMAFEDKLRLKKNRTTFQLTDKDVVLVNPSLWWRKYLIRRSLFTILLRAGQSYELNQDNFFKALYSDNYAAQTKPALKWFLKRYTLVKRKHISSGWRNTFQNCKTEEQVLKILEKPPKKHIVESTIPPATSEDANQPNCFDNEMLEKARRVRVG